MVFDRDVDGCSLCCVDVQYDVALGIVGFAEPTSANAPAAEFAECVDFLVTQHFRFPAKRSIALWGEMAAFDS